ncbi:MAG: tyrosine-protein kinase [Actinomycetota bacterium]|nr:tyrosine-protein kinase [Actinomycetota bacterium]
MTIAQYLRLLKEQWVPVLVLTVLGTLGAGSYSLLAAPTYQASTQLFVSISAPSDSIGELSQGGTFSQQRVKSYTDLLTSPSVLEPIITELALPTDARTLAKRLTATNPIDTVLIDVTVEDTSPTRAADIANSIASRFPGFVEKLETPPGQPTSPVKVSTTRSAVPPSDPIAPRTTLNLALGLLVGLGLGVGAAVLRDTLDRTVNSRTAAGEIAGAPVLGAVADDPETSQMPLISHDTFSARAEAYRQLRTNIRFLSVDHQVTSLVVTGSVKSEGKTTTAANIAIALAQNGEHVALIDADLRRPAIADIFGIPSGVGLTTVLLGDAGVDTALQRWRDDLPLFLLPAGPLPPNPSELIGSARMAELIHHLTGHGMTVVVDSPPLLPVTDATILARITDGALIVTRVGSTRVDEFSTAVESLRTAGAPVLGVVLNRVPRRGRTSTYGAYGSRYEADPAMSGHGVAGRGGIPSAAPFAGPPAASPAFPSAGPFAGPADFPAAGPHALPSGYAPALSPGYAPAVPSGYSSALPPDVRPGDGVRPGNDVRPGLGYPVESLDAVLNPAAAPTLLSPVPENAPHAAPIFRSGAPETEVVDLRQPVGAGPLTVPLGMQQTNGQRVGRPGVAELNGAVNGRPSPYSAEGQQANRGRGRRSAAPPKES